MIRACRAPRDYCAETWITEQMLSAYIELHRLGFAHSVEVWDEDRLVGGLYGVKLGGVFCGESMFHVASNASKIAFWHLCQWCQATGVELIDCQMVNPHLMSLGARSIPRQRFLSALAKLVVRPTIDWRNHPRLQVSQLAIS